MSSAAGEVEEYNLWVEDVRVTSANAADVLGDASVRYNPETATLTLSDATIDGYSKIDSFDSAIYSNDDLSIELIGDNKISLGINEATGETFGYGILSKKAVSIFGDGSLTVESTNYGIYSYTGLEIIDCTVSATASIFAIYAVEGELGIYNSDVSAIASNKNGYGIGNFYGDIVIENSDVFAIANFGIVAQKGGKILITDSRVDCVGNNKAMYSLEDCLTINASKFNRIVVRTAADRLGIVGAKIAFCQNNIVGSDYTRFVSIDSKSNFMAERVYNMLMSQIRIFKALIK